MKQEGQASMGVGAGCGVTWVRGTSPATSVYVQKCLQSYCLIIKIEVS